MAYDRHIDKTEEVLCELRDVYGRNDVDRLLDGLQAGRINSEEKVVLLALNNNKGLIL